MARIMLLNSDDCLAALVADPRSTSSSLSLCQVAISIGMCRRQEPSTAVASTSHIIASFTEQYHRLQELIESATRLKPTYDDIHWSLCYMACVSSYIHYFSFSKVASMMIRSIGEHIRSSNHSDDILSAVAKCSHLIMNSIDNVYNRIEANLLEESTVNGSIKYFTFEHIFILFRFIC